MSDNFYSKVNNEELILRDYLAADRTKLANERTFLAYIRTGLYFVISGLAFVNYPTYAITSIIGWIFMPLGLVTISIGAVRCRRMNRRISKIDYQVQKRRDDYVI